MEFQYYINEIKNGVPLKTNSIEGILSYYEPICFKAAQKTECYKWSRWLKDSSIHIFPCVCPIRNDECIFLEVYYKLQKSFNLILKEGEYGLVLQSYHLIQKNQKATFEWIKHNEELGLEISYFEPTIEIMLNINPYKLLKIELDKSDFPNLLKFQEIFNEYYYSKEYEAY